MAILEAQSFVACDGIDELDLFARFKGWYRSDPNEVGTSIEHVLTSEAGWPEAVIQYARANPHKPAGNGSVMRSSFAAGRWSFANLLGTAEVGRRLSVVTHGDPAASEGRALYHMLVSEAVRGRDPFDDTDEAIGNLKVGHKEVFARALNGTLQATVGNGTVWGCLRDAVTAVRLSDGFEECMRRACDAGGHSSSVAALAGGLAGALFGIDDLPNRWLDQVHGEVEDQVIGVEKLRALMKSVLDIEEPIHHASKNWRPEHTDVRYGYDQFFLSQLRNFRQERRDRQRGKRGT